MTTTMTRRRRRRQRKHGHDDDVTFITLFCGAGGDAIGLTAAGMRCVLAANHWERAIQTHAANFPDAEHLCVDINHYDMRRLPPADVLFASVICTEVSPAGGTKKTRGQLEMFGHIDNAAFERTRACALDVIRACEVHRYKAVVVENVVEFARDWELFDWWVDGMDRLGYDIQIANASSAHLYSETIEPAPQWRDRIYIVFTRKGMRKPTLEPSPWAVCDECGDVVRTVQSWKRPDRRKLGKFGQQYVYRCAECFEVVEPLILPADAAIDWTDLGSRIGDRPRPLAAATMRRIEVGLGMFSQPITLATGGGTYERPGSGYVRAWPAMEAPLRTRTATAGDGVATPPFITMLRANNRPTGMDEPLATVTTARNHYLTVPGAFIQKHHGGVDYPHPEHMVKSTGEPIPTVVVRPNLSLVVPYRRGRAKTTAEPLHTVATKESAALCSIEIDPMNCHFRMLKPREHLRAQRFHDSYIVKGNQGEQTMQAGNAVSANAAQWVGEALMEVL